MIILLVPYSSSINYTDNAALMLVSIQSILSAISSVSFLLRTIIDSKDKLKAVERIQEYIDLPLQEAEWCNDKVPKQWVQTGIIKVQNVSFQYHSDLPEVIKNLSFNVMQNEKIGIVGRSGSGKSTITLGILRILEILDKNSGFIEIDELNIKQIGLHDLRNNITIVPQDPILFSSTLRKNIDPFNLYIDKDIIQALKKTFIFDHLLNIYKQQKNYEQYEFLSNEEIEFQMLDIQIQSEDFSLGQRQLISLARALVRKSKILLMDEATASLDELTDLKVQQMICKEFQNTTVLTIAHRLNTIIQYDKIMVLKDGQIQVNSFCDQKEFDTPKNLINNPNSYVYQLIKQQNPQFQENIFQLIYNRESNQIIGTQLVLN